MNRFITFFNYNWFRIIKNNIKNNKIKKIKQKNIKIISKLVLKKEICALIFITAMFLVTYYSSIEMYKMTYQNNIIFYIIKDNIKQIMLWFIFLSILPILTNILIRNKIKINMYLLLSIIYLLSNLYNIFMIIYFVTALINVTIPSIIGLINIIITVIVNSNIIIEINENYLK